MGGWSGLNLRLKVLEAAAPVEAKAQQFFEVKCGDESGTVVLSLREAQKDVAGVDKVLEVRNGSVKMVKGHIRVAIDKWGKLEAVELGEGEDFTVEEAAEKNVSNTEYELVQ